MAGPLVSVDELGVIVSNGDSEIGVVESTTEDGNDR